MLTARLMKSNMKLKITSDFARDNSGASRCNGMRQPLGSIKKNAKASDGMALSDGRDQLDEIAGIG